MCTDQYAHVGANCYSTVHFLASGSDPIEDRFAMCKCICQNRAHVIACFIYMCMIDAETSQASGNIATTTEGVAAASSDRARHHCITGTTEHRQEQLGS